MLKTGANIIPGYHGKYDVTSDGRIYSYNYGRRTELKLSEHKGYRRVALSSGNKRKIYQVHVLVARAFIPNPLKKPFVNHIDGNRSNNNVENLEWVTASENQKHAYTHLGIQNGHKNYSTAKLYPSQELRNKLVALGIPRYKHNLAELGEMLPITITREGIYKNKHNYYLSIEKGDGNLWVYTYRDIDNSVMGGIYLSATNEADARAKMLIYLLENKLITL